MKKTIFLLSLFVALSAFTGTTYAATITVDIENTVAVDGFCSFDEAISSSETDASTECIPGAGGDTINFSAGLTDIIISNNISVNQNTIIQGAVDGTVIDLSGFNWNISPTATTDDIQFLDLEAKNGPASGLNINVTADAANPLTITFDGVHIHDNSGSGIYYTKDYAIAREVKVYVNNSIIEGNIGSLGAGIFVDECVSMGFSDMRVKRDISFIKNSVSGIPIYSFRYKKGFSPFAENDDTLYMGTLAQEIISTHPYAVTEDKNNIYSVNYNLIDVDFISYADYKNPTLKKEKQVNKHYTLEINNSIIRDNYANSQGGGIYNACGHVKINQSTISGNESGLEGGGIYINQGATDFVTYKNTFTEIYNSTFFGNISGLEAGGIYLSNPDSVNFTPELIINNTTIAENIADPGATGAGIFIENGDVSIYNTIIGDNTGVVNQCGIANPLTNSLGNASTDASCGLGFIPSIVTGLSALTDNGGTSLLGPNGLLGNILTMLIDNTSALFDSGDAGECLATDQIGTARPQETGCDIGAFEVIIPNTPPVITSDGGGATANISVPENGTTATTATATDTEDDLSTTNLIYSIDPLSPDVALFVIDATTGILTFITSPDFENPTDAGADNVYDIYVVVTDSGTLTDIQEIAITITDENENSSSSSHSGGSSISYVCKDATASNYSAFGRHRQSKCEYNEDAVTESPATETNTETVETTDSAEQPVMCPIFTQHMRKGDRDGKSGQEKQESGISSIMNEIKLLQTKLTLLGFDAGPLDGVFGTKTEIGVRAFQQAHFSQVLDPWGLTHTTGRFYQSSERWMNEVLGCHDTVTIDKGVYLNSRKS